jgi:hypothetical protein
MTTSSYPKLPNSTSIRTLRFEIVPESRDIRGSFTIIDLADKHHLNYEALSYAWGNPTPVTQAGIEQHDLKIGIAQNLADGLARLRRDGQTELIWIDAICIDQRNVEERNQQVRLMDRVYSQAVQVKVWLGLDTDDSILRAFNVLKQCANPLKDDSNGKTTFEAMGSFERFKITPEWDAAMQDLQLSLREDGKPDASTWMESTFQKPWFTRLWVVQEVFLAKQLSVVAGAAATIDFDILCRGTFAYQFLDPYIWGMNNFARLFEARALGHKLSLDSFHNFEGFKATEQWDYVYALLGIVEIPSDVLDYFTVDYEKAVSEVFADATRGVVEASLNLQILQYSTFNVTQNTGPSWARDWALSQGGIQYMRSHAYERLNDVSARLKKHERADELILEGRGFGKIVAYQRCSPSYDPSNSEAVVKRIIFGYTWARAQANISGTGDIDELVKFDQAYAIIMIGALYVGDKSLARWDFDAARWILKSFYKILLLWANRFAEAFEVLTNSPTYEPGLVYVSETYTCTYNATTLEDDAEWALSMIDKEHGVIQMEERAGLSVYTIAEDDFWWLKLAYMVTDGSTFIYTDDGILGVVRGNVEMGDQVCVLYGGTVPFVLRQDDMENHWRLSGTACVDPIRFNESAYWETGKDQFFSLI